MDFDQTWHIRSPQESLELCQFSRSQVKGQCHRINLLLRIILVNTRINILQWILTKFGTYLDLKRIWNPIDFQGQRSRSQGLIFRRGDTPRFALPLFFYCRVFKYKVSCVFGEKLGKCLVNHTFISVLKLYIVTLRSLHLY